MDFSAFLDALQHLETGRMARYLGELNLGDLSHNPWFLGAMGTLAVIALLCKWRTLLALIVGLTGLTWLINATVAQGTGVEELGSQNFIIFFGGAVLIVLVMIYLVFIRPE